MPVNQEVKGTLAKLLATEDLIVENKQVETACFNVQTRVLTLPLWERASNFVYDMLVGHEVGHALFTPDEDWLKKVKVPPQFVNVVEDARIEKMIKRKYMGLAKTFYRGYKELHDGDFFQIADEDIDTFNLADRANLYFKIGNFLDISFSNEEMEIVDLIDACDTFDDVLKAAEKLYLYCKQQQEKEKFTPPPQEGDAEAPANELVEEKTEEESPEGEEQPQEQPEITESDNSDTSSSADDLEVLTADALEEKIRDLVSGNGQESIYVELPKPDLKSVIASNSDVHKEIDTYYKVVNQGTEVLSIFDEEDANYEKFKRSAQKEVNYLVKEFECRKSADAYARSTTSRTGVLDCTKLHTYKYNEDLFKKVTTLSDGKNHGLVFVLDWSGSMSDVMVDTIKQLYNLLWFCKKVSIPFEVYAFTNEWRRKNYDWETHTHMPADLTPYYEKKEGLLAVEETFSLMNLLTSKVNSQHLEHQMRNIWRIAASFKRPYGAHYSIPEKLYLSGTPLNESLVCLHQILPQFQRDNKLQKVQCIVLTDGEANHLAYHKSVQRRWENEPYMGSRHICPGNTFLRDRKLGTTYVFDGAWHSFTDTLLQNLKDNFPNVNFIGMRVLCGRDVNRFINLYYDRYSKETENLQKDWKKQKSFTIKKSGYHVYFGLSSSALSNDVDFEVDEGATKTQIKSAFVKSLKTKQLNKKVLGEFISLVV